MKKTYFYVLATVLASSIIVVATMAMTVGATAVPTVNDVPSPVDADKLTITGTAEAEAKITITGGAYQLSPTYADEDGYWEKVVILSQEATNNFTITAAGTDGKVSDPVVITVVESTEEAQAYESSYGIDRTAPNSPTVNETDSPVDADTITITGTAETNTTIIVSGDDNTEAAVDSDGVFSVEVTLQQNDTNQFYLSARDSSGNISSSTTVEVEEISVEDNTDTASDTTDTTDSTSTVGVDFSDVEVGSWYEDYVATLAESGVVSGYDNTDLFGPGDYITRAAITKIALEAFDFEILDADTIDFGDGGLTDLEPGSWYEDYVASAYYYGVVNGYPNGTFDPGAYVNRAEAATILMAASEIADLTHADLYIGDEDSWENPFSDMTEADWYYEYVMSLYTGGVLNGYDNGNFGGGDNITRAAACKITVELLNLIDEIRSTPTI